MAAIIQGERGAFLDGVAGSHQLVKAVGEFINSSWPVNNVGDAEGYARIRLDILQLVPAFVELGTTFVIPVGGATAAQVFAPPERRDYSRYFVT